MNAFFVQIKTELGKAYDVAAAAVDNVECVSEVYSISGQHDRMTKAAFQTSPVHITDRRSRSAIPALTGRTSCSSSRPSPAM